MRSLLDGRNLLCDLENLRDRHVSYYDQCYVTENDKRVKIHNIVIYNSLDMSGIISMRLRSQRMINMR